MKAQILTEKVGPGCRLPPVRVLARQLGISKNTVQAAYDELTSQGVAESRERVGLFVVRTPPNVAAQPDASVPTPQMVSLPVEPLRRRGKAPFARQPIQLSSVFVDPALLPRDQLARCFRAVLRQPGVDAPYHEQGFPPLRHRIAERLRRRGIQARAEDVVTTVGSQQALDILCRALVTRSIATEDPAYDTGKRLLEMNSMRPVGLPLDPFLGVDLEEWERRIAQARPGLAYLTTSFHNPTGYSYTTSELDQIAAWSRRYGFGIVEDDWGSDILSYSEFRPSLRARGGDGVFYINTFTKKLLPSLRLGYIVGNADTVSALVASKVVSCLGVSPLIEAAVFEFLDQGYYDTYLRRLQGELDLRYRNCLDALRAAMPDGVRWTSPGGGPILWMELPHKVNLADLAARLQARDVAITLSENAFFGRPHLNGFRIGYAMPSVQDMQTGIGLLAEEVKRALR